MAGENQSCGALDAAKSVDPAHRGFAATFGPRSRGQSLDRPWQRRRLSRRGAGLRVTSTPGMVHLADIGDTVDRITGRIDCVTARAVAPLNQLIGLVEPLMGKGAKALFLKGQDVEAELTEATKYWKIAPHLHSSRTGGGGWIVELDQVERRDQSATGDGTGHDRN